MAYGERNAVYLQLAQIQIVEISADSSLQDKTFYVLVRETLDCLFLFYQVLQFSNSHFFLQIILIQFNSNSFLFCHLQLNIHKTLS